MSKTRPYTIFKHLKRGKIAKGTAFDILISYVKNSHNEKERVESIQLLSQLEIVDEKLYKILEEFLVSDSNYEISVVSAEIIMKNFFVNGINSVIWVLKHYNSPYQLAGVLRALIRLKPEFLRRFFLKELNNFVLEHIEKVQHLHKSFFTGLINDYNRLFESKEMDEFSTEHLMDILINFETLIFICVYYGIASDLEVEFRDGYVVRLEMRHSPAGTEKLSDIEGILNFERLERIIIKYTSFKSLEGIERFTMLKHLIFAQSELKEIKYINNLRSLETLGLMSSRLTEIKGLSGCHRLTILDLGSNQIAEIKGLSGCHRLTTLDLSSNEITEIKNLDSLKSLEFLALNFNKIHKIEGLENLTNLKKLYLIGNEITKIGGLETLVNLRDLHLSDNKIKKVEGLNSLEKLEKLDLHNNGIEILENIENLILEKNNRPIIINLENNCLSKAQIKKLYEKVKRKK